MARFRQLGNLQTATTGEAPPLRAPLRVLWPRRRWLSVWSIGTLATALLVALPILTVVGVALTPSGDIWQHLVSTVLSRYVSNTLALMVGVGIGTFMIGVATAWLVTMCRFPGRRVFEWALMLPMAMPAYVVAFTYVEFLDYAGPVQSSLRALFGFESGAGYWFPNIRSLPGAVVVMSLVFYPYVYLLARAAFLQQSVCALEASRVLGRGAWASFFTVALPMARPAIVIGLALALMETLNDFGTVQHFAVPTFTVGIFDVWLNMYSAAGAAQLASVALLFVLVLLALERISRRGRRFHEICSGTSPLPGYRLPGARAWLATATCVAPILLGFLLPGALLLGWAIETHGETYYDSFAADVANSLTLATLAAGLAVLIGLFLAYGLRVNGGPVLRVATGIACLGYAVPGAVIAVGVMIPLGWFDNSLDAFMRETFGISTGLLLSGTVAAVTFAYLVRFLAVSFGAIEAGLSRVKPSMEDAARTLGCGPGGTLVRVHLPLVRSSFLTAGILVFVDVMKELPATLILRPFNFNTLATRVYEYASDEMLRECSLAAVTIVAAGILPVILLTHAMRHSRAGTNGA